MYKVHDMTESTTSRKQFQNGRKPEERIAKKKRIPRKMETFVVYISRFFSTKHFFF